MSLICRTHFYGKSAVWIINVFIFTLAVWGNAKILWNASGTFRSRRCVFLVKHLVKDLQRNSATMQIPGETRAQTGGSVCLLCICAVGHVCIYLCTSERKTKPNANILRTKGRYVVRFHHSRSVLCNLSNREKRPYVCLLTLLRVCVR